MADIELTVTCSLPANTSATINVYEDTNNDGTAEATATQALSDGTNTYTLSGFTGGDATGYDYWWELTTFSTSDLTATPSVSSVEIDTDPSTGDSLTAQDIATAAPTFESPTITQQHGLTAQDISAGVPAIASPTITQQHALTGADIATATPTIEQPTVSSAADHALTSQDIVTSAPTIEQPSLTASGADHALTAQNAVSGTPTIGSASISSQMHVLVAQDIVTPNPVVNAASIYIPQPLTLYADTSTYRTAPVYVIETRRPLVVHRVKVQSGALALEEV